MTDNITQPTTTQPDRHRDGPRIGTIVWGALLTAAAVLALLLILGGPLSPGAILWGVVGFGALLVIAAIVTGIVRAAHASARKGDQPIG
jgi:hypothetical protein